VILSLSRFAAEHVPTRQLLDNAVAESSLISLKMESFRKRVYKIRDPARRRL